MPQTFKTWGAFVNALCARVAQDAPPAGTDLAQRILSAQTTFVAFSGEMGHTTAQTQALREELKGWYRRSACPRSALTLICDYVPTAYNVRGVWTPPEN